MRGSPDTPVKGWTGSPPPLPREAALHHESVAGPSGPLCSQPWFSPVCVDMLIWGGSPSCGPSTSASQHMASALCLSVLVCQEALQQPGSLRTVSGLACWPAVTVSLRSVASWCACEVEGCPSQNPGLQAVEARRAPPGAEKGLSQLPYLCKCTVILDRWYQTSGHPRGAGRGQGPGNPIFRK